MKIALGTVQLGLDYGISNRAGQVSPEEARRILALAGRSGIRVLDTAAAYGDAEQRLGELLPPDAAFDVVTKLPRLPAEPGPGVAQWVRDRLAESLQRLRVPRLYGLLMHQAADLLGPQGDALWAALEAARAAGTVMKVGASVYTGTEIDALLGRFPLQLIQLPLSVLDQRLVRSGHLAKLRKAGVEVHARSVFLQGVLLMAPEDLPAHLAPAREPLRALRAAARAAGRMPLDLALGCVLRQPEVDRAVLGVTREEELAEILAAAQRPSAAQLDCGAFALDDEAILNPGRWPTRR